VTAWLERRGDGNKVALSRGRENISATSCLELKVVEDFSFIFNPFYLFLPYLKAVFTFSLPNSPLTNLHLSVTAHPGTSSNDGIFLLQ
jgi:hypothetical protein